MTGTLQLTLLGQADVRLAGEPVTGFYSGKAQALLFYLAVTGQTHTRPALAGLLWADLPDADALMNLRQVLTNLRKLVGDHLTITRQTVAFKRDSDYWLDIEVFQAGVESTQRPSPPPSSSGRGSLASPPQGGIEGGLEVEQLRQAVDLYQGDFLAGFYVRDAPLFEEWLLAHRAWLREVALDALQKLAAYFARRGDYRNGIAYSRRLLAREPWREAAHRHLMLLLARSGQRSAALAQYQACRQMLAEELGVEPSAETLALYRRIQAAEAAPRPNLPFQPTSFIGRQKEVAEIQHLLLDEPGCRLLNLVGPGGIGKTRLALEAATQTFETFPQEIAFVSLAPVGEIVDIAPAMADALHFTFYGSTEPKDQLLDYLRQKTLLLVLDNFEHLLKGAGLLSDILRHAPHVTLLATSRERLNLQEEWVYKVQGLPFPAGGSQTSEVSKTSEVLLSYNAVQLFLQRARQIEAGFTPAPAEMADIGRVCQLVEGMPLGLELAAPWIKVLSCREIAAEIERSLDFLTTPLQNVPERHRSLRVVFEQTWGRLPAAEQTVLMQLAVFRRGCTREAAEAVTGATLPVLSALVDKALLRRTNTGRYELHELVRQFAEAQLQTDPAAFEQARQRHRDYFIAFLEVRTAGVKRGKQKETLVEIKADIDNVRLAWRRAVAGRDAEAIERSAECLFVYYLYGSGHYEGLSAFQQAAAAFIEGSATPIAAGLPDELVVLDKHENLVGFLLAGQAYFLTRTRDPHAGQMLVEQALALLRRAEPRDRRKEGFALLWLAWAIALQGRDATALAYVEPTLALLIETSNRWAEGWILILWGNSICYIHPTQAEEVYKRCLAVCRESGDQMMLGYTSQQLSGVSMELGRYVQAKQYIDQAVRVFEDLGNVLGLGYALMRRGQLAVLLGEYGQAVEDCRQSATYFTEVRTEQNVIWVQVDLGTALRLHGDHSQAEQVLQQSLEAATAMNHKWHMARCLQNLGCLAYDQGELHEAEQFQRETLALWQELELEVREAGVWRYLGQVMVTSGEDHHPEATQYFRQALELATKHQAAPIALDICVGAAQLLAQAKNLEQAIELVALAEQHEASIFETRRKARHHLAELMNQLPPEMAHAAQTRGQTLDWQIAARRLIEALAVEGEV
ncbi:MAG: transcriptional activator [Chloroflexota bacterium]|nr:MAG: transcriptional activator [Chloroflexota bacterium]